MKMTKRVVAWILTLCMIVPLLPGNLLDLFTLSASAAPLTENYRYELDTDGIDDDPNAVYLLVNGNAAGNYSAMKFRYTSSNKSPHYQTVQIRSEDGVLFIEPFAGDAECQFSFTHPTSGSLVPANNPSSYYLTMGSLWSSVAFASGTASSSDNLTFAHKGNGAYTIKGSLTYLNPGSGENGIWTERTWNNPRNIYLFKQVKHTDDLTVTFDANGANAGCSVPEKIVLTKETGFTFTVPAPAEELRRDVEDDTFLFRGWNTKEDGTGETYKPGDTVPLTSDLTLYVDWYQQVKYSVAFISYLDGVPTDMDAILGEEREFYAREENGEEYLLLKKRGGGVYSAKTPVSGTYLIYYKAGETYEEVHGHKVIVYEQEGTTECMNWSVNYDLAGGAWAEGEAPAAENHHQNDKVNATESVPVREGYRFLGWSDGKGGVFAGGATVTPSVQETITLTALWEETITVTVHLVLEHLAEDGIAQDLEADLREVILSLMRGENGVNLPVDEKALTEGYVSDEIGKTTTYTVVYENMPQGDYRAAALKNYYEEIASRTEGEDDQDQVIYLTLRYAPDNFSLNFNVQAHADAGEKELYPKAVNVKITQWKDGAWQVIDAMAGNHAPISVTLDENGAGSGFYPVWKYDPETGAPLAYRVEVVSYVYPDGSIVPAAEANIYSAQVSLEGEGMLPAEDAEEGAYFETDGQKGVPTVEIDVHPFTVTFEAGEGKVDGKKTLVLAGQYRYPALTDYVAIPDGDGHYFENWTDGEGNPAIDRAGALLTGDVTYYALYNDGATLSGDLYVGTTYMNGDQLVQVKEIDRPAKVLVILQKKTGDAYNDVASRFVTVEYDEEHRGTASYEFKNIPVDGSEYRIQVQTANYLYAYDNNADSAFTEEERSFIHLGQNDFAPVDAALTFSAEAYDQLVMLDASQIFEDFRPDGALLQVLYSNLGDAHQYHLIAQHENPPYGVEVSVDELGLGSGSESIWNRRWDDQYYEYQLRLKKLYGSEEGAYTEEGTDFTTASPFTVEYSTPSSYIRQNTLTATLVPKVYPVYLDLGDADPSEIQGMEAYMYDDGSGEIGYAYFHTWSYAGSFGAFPYREGYVFRGWQAEEDNDLIIDDQDGGTVYVGATLAKPVTLVAIWEKLEGTDVTVRHLELNTDKVLERAEHLFDRKAGDRVIASDAAHAITGYNYAGAYVVGNVNAYQDKAENPALTVTDDPLKNLIVIYYLPDGSDGYTEQVESNLRLNKEAVLENNGTYTITMDAHTLSNPVTTRIQQNTPLDIVLVLDQSGSLAENDFAYLKELQSSVGNFVESVANHGRRNEVDHRIAIVGYAGNASDGHSSDPVKATGGKTTDSWINTGVFDSNGEFHLYNVNGFNYTKLSNTSQIASDGIYYISVTEGGQTKYLLLTHHDEYRHLIDKEEARMALLRGQTVYGYVFDDAGSGSFVELTRNSSGLWLYGDRQLYSEEKFFTFHTDVWTYRNGLDPSVIHAYGVGSAYAPLNGDTTVYTRAETTSSSYQHSIYEDALVPVTVGAGGAGDTNPGLLKAIDSFGADGATRASYGMEMANEVLKVIADEEDTGRLRLVVMFTDGEPGYLGFQSGNYYNQAVTEANNAISQAYISKNTYGAYVYTIGLYESAGVEATSDVAYYMNALSSNYPTAKKMDDIKTTVSYKALSNGTPLENNGKMFIKYNSTYYVVKYGYVRTSGSSQTQNQWYYTRNSTNYSISTQANPTANRNGQVGSYIIYLRSGGYKDTEHSGYYSTTESADQLKAYFENVLEDITTKITTEIILHEDTILRDIMGEGLVLTPGTVVTAYKEKGVHENGAIKWSGVHEQVAQITVPENPKGIVSSPETTKIDVVNANGTTGEKTVPYIQIYNLDSANPVDSSKENYKPHTIDITGYDFEHWFISEEHPEGYKMIVTVTQVEARDEVDWGRSVLTNHEQSGLWLPADKNGNRELLLAFDQPNTIFVERAYVLDYGKEFTLSGWYFDDNGEQNATPVHLDLDVASGMNYFDPASPNLRNSAENAYGNTRYGNVWIENGAVHYKPTTTRWDGFDEFYVFGNTWRSTVTSQSANENGNLWNKVSVIPANNVYYEDSFLTVEGEDGANGTVGFTFTGAWETVTEGESGANREDPEAGEEKPYGAVHGWTDDLADDLTFSDGSAHGTGLDGGKGASVSFTFTGMGVDVYTRTNAKSGMVVAVLNQLDAQGKPIAGTTKSIAIDNLSKSGEYYHIPTVSFNPLGYGTYSVTLIATAASAEMTGEARTEYYVDGIRVYNPLGLSTNYASSTVQGAYGLENNAVFTEIRDILLDNESFMADTGEVGAVFIDWIREGQGTGDDQVAEGTETYEIGTFEAYGPKNEVYLAAGQAIVLKVSGENDYFVGLKSLTGKTVTANISGEDRADPTRITLSHTVDMYYRVTPIDGYIVIQNGSEGGEILSLTRLRATNPEAVPENIGLLSVTVDEAIDTMMLFHREMSVRKLPGDVDCDGKLTLDDAIYLLYHVNFSEEYPAARAIDYDSSGEVDMDDAIYLLYALMFPDRYPLQ